MFSTAIQLFLHLVPTLPPLVDSTSAAHGVLTQSTSHPLSSLLYRTLNFFLNLGSSSKTPSSTLLSTKPSGRSGTLAMRGPATSSSVTTAPLVPVPLASPALALRRLLARARQTATVSRALLVVITLAGSILPTCNY
jgi:hypothetical protein